MKPAQENHKHALPTEQQNSKYSWWNMPVSGCQIFLPENYMNSKGSVDAESNNNRPNINNNSVLEQPQTSSGPAGPNSSQQFKPKTIINIKSLNDTGRDLNSCVLHKERHTDATNNNLPKDPSQKRLTRPSNLKYLATGNAPHGYSGSFGGQVYRRLSTERSSNLQTCSSRERNLEQNSAAKKAVVIVTPLSPTETPSVSNKTTKQDQPPVAGEHRPDGGLCDAVGAKSPILTDESSSQSENANAQKISSVVAAPTKCLSSNGAQNEASVKTSNNKQAAGDKKTDAYCTIPVIEWPLNKLHVLMSFIEKIEGEHQKTVNETDAGKEILKLYWNGNFHEFRNAVNSGIYESVMEEVYTHRTSEDDVILRQIKNDARKQLAKEFHILKHKEVAPQLLYESSWMNLNKNLDDIDRECGYSSCYTSLYSNSQERVQHEDNSAHKLRDGLLDASERTSLMRQNQCSTETVDNIPDKQQTLSTLKEKNSDSESLCDEQSLPVTNDNNSSELTEQTNCQSNTVNPLEALITLVRGVEKRRVSTGMSGKPKLIDGFSYHFGARSPVSPELSSQNGCTSLPKCNPVVAEKQVCVTTSRDQNGSSKTITNSDCAVTGETLSKPSEQVAFEVNKDVDEMDTSPFIKNVSPHETPSIISVEIQGLDEELHDSAAHSEMMHKPPCLESPQVLETKSMEEQINMEGFEEKAKNSACTIQSTFLDVPNKPSITEHDQCKTEIVNRVPVEENTWLGLKETSPDGRSLNKNLHVSFNKLAEDKQSNCSSKHDDVVTEQTSCQSNTVNPLQALRNLVKVLEKTKHQRSAAGTSEKTTQAERGNSSFKCRSPVLTNELTCTRARNPVFGKQQEVVLSSQIATKSEVNNLAHTAQNTILGSPCEPSRTGCQSPTETVTKVPVEEQMCWELKQRNSDNRVCSLLGLIQTDDNSLPKSSSVVTEQTNCQTDTVNPLQGLTDLLTKMNKRDVSLSIYDSQVRKQNISKREHQRSAETSKDQQTPKSEKNDSENQRIHEMLPIIINDQSPAVTDHNDSNPLKAMASMVWKLKKRRDSSIKHQQQTRRQDILLRNHQHSTDASRDGRFFGNSFGAKGPVGTDKSPKPGPVITEQQEISPQMQHESHHKTESAETEEIVICETIPELCEDEKMEATASFKIHVLPHEVAKLCFEAEKIEDFWLNDEELHESIAGLSEKQCESLSWLNSEKYDRSDEQCDSSLFYKLFHHAPKRSQEEHIVGSSKEAKSRNHSAEASGSPDESTSRTDFTSPPNLNPAVSEQQEILPSPQMHHESSEKRPKDDCVASQVHTEELGEMEASASIKTHVLPHDITEHWFPGEMTEKKDLQKDTAHMSSKNQKNVQVLDLRDVQAEVQVLDLRDVQAEVQVLDLRDVQAEVQVLDLGSEREVHIGDIKPKERTNSDAVKLESYCCLSKWFQTLKFAGDSLCICQMKAELSAQDIKTHGSNLEVQKNENDHVNFSNDYRCTELRMSTLDQDASECTEEKSLILHTDTSNNAAVDEFVKGHSFSKEVFGEERATPEQKSDELPTKCAQDVSVNKQHMASDEKRTETLCFSPYGSSSNTQDGEKQKRCKDSSDEPPENLEIISHQNNEGRRKRAGSMTKDDALVTKKKKPNGSLQTHNQSRSSELHKVTETKVSGVSKENAISSTSAKHLFNARQKLKSSVCLADKNKQKTKSKLGIRQMSLNQFIIRRKVVPSKFMQSHETVTKSKYELGNPALMPSRECGVGLEFKVLPRSFNFRRTELSHVQTVTSQTPKEISYPEDITAKRMKSSHASIQGKWCFSPLKTKNVQSAGDSGSCSVFQQFKRRYQERRKELDSRQNLKSS